MYNDVIQVLNSYGIQGDLTISPRDDGSINRTFIAIENKSQKGFVTQELHSMFPEDHVRDIFEISSFLRGKNLMCPTLVTSSDGALIKRFNEKIWRVFQYIPGCTNETGLTPSQAYSAGQLVGKFHDSMRYFPGNLKYSIPHFHDTEYYMQRLQEVSAEYEGSPKYTSLQSAIDFVVNEYRGVGLTLDSLPIRLIHGDLKVNNILFDEKNVSAVAILDLDTVMRKSIVVDLGDAVRTWCGKVSEKGQVSFDMGILKAMLEGYASTAIFLSNKEWMSVFDGIRLLFLEITARYLTDAMEESYFKLDVRNFSSLYEQYSYKANCQITLYRQILSRKKEISELLQTLAKTT